MSGTLYVDAQSFHDVTLGDRRLLFHIPSSGLFELDAVGSAVLDFIKTRSEFGENDVREWFARSLGAPAIAEVAEMLHDLRSLAVLKEAAESPPAPLPSIRQFPLSTLVLNVNTGCNLSCSYCYKEDLEAPSRGRKMELDTACRSIDLLIAEGASRDRLSVVFFGGEPLTNLPLIRDVVDYAERRCAEAGKVVDFSLTTNATMLTEATIDYLDQHRFGISISMDGPKAVHDRRRLTISGHGTYDVVAAKSRLLLDRYRSRPVGARVTLTRGVTDVVAIHRHLKHEIGFAEVGFAPVTAGPADLLNLDGAELQEVFAGLKALGQEFLAAALDNRSIGFSNINQLMSDLYEGRKKTLPCGAGVGLLAVDGDGDLNLCHRFTGSSLPTFGNVRDGIARERLGAFLEAASDRSNTGCASCRIRNLCAGGCYHESYSHFNDPLSPTYHYCELMREWVDFGIEIYVELREKNPAFLRRFAQTPDRSVSP